MKLELLAFILSLTHLVACQDMEIRSTPTLPNGGVFTVFGESAIKATPATIWNTILNTATWPEWSTFVPKVQIDKQPAGTEAQSAILVEGTEMTFTVQMNRFFKTSSTEKVNLLGQGPKDSDPVGTKYQVDWVYTGTPGVVMRSERVSIIEKLGDGTCHYQTWETFAGPAAYVTKAVLGSDLQARFDDWVRDLKAYTEQQS